MLIATALATALTINVSAAPDIPPALVSRVLAETDAIWRYSGFTFAWQRTPCEEAAGLRVVIGHDARRVREGGFALGWIVFGDEKTPAQELYVSYENAYQLMVESPGVVGVVGRMPPIEREILLGRAMGRALAHELGHYLLESKEHTLTGLMQAHLSAVVFFGSENRMFKLDSGQRRAIAGRLARESVLVGGRRDSSAATRSPGL